MFCRHMSWRTSWDIAWSELAMGSIIPASGAGGLALGAWILHEGGMPGEQIARRSVAFFLLKSSVNFVAVAVLGVALFVGLIGPSLSPLLTLLPAVAAAAVIVGVVWIGRLGPGEEAPPDAGRVRRWWARRAPRAGRRDGRGAEDPAHAAIRWSSAGRSATGSSTTPSSGPPSTPSARRPRSR